MSLTTLLDPALESLLAFWAEAGVDAAVEDEAVDKLRPREPARAPVPPATTNPPALVSSDLAVLLAEARRLAEAAMDLSALRTAAAAFDPGPFRPTGARRVFLGRGEAPAEVVAIGGGPGAEEVRADEAFAGPEGRLLDRMLAAAGLTGRALCLHAALWSTPGDREASPEEAALARPFLERAIALAAPKALLLLGDTPARLVLGRPEGAPKLRTERLEWRPETGGAVLPVFVTFHPGLLLRQPRAKKQAWADLLTLMGRVAGL